MVLLDWPPPEHFWIGRKRGNSRCRLMTNVRAERLLKIPAALGPSCVSPMPQLKREQSLWPEFGWIPRNPYDLSKGYFAMTFLSSSPICPATQSGLRKLTPAISASDLAARGASRWCGILLNQSPQALTEDSARRARLRLEIFL